MNGELVRRSIEKWKHGVAVLHKQKAIALQRGASSAAKGRKEQKKGCLRAWGAWTRSARLGRGEAMKRWKTAHFLLFRSRTTVDVVRGTLLLGLARRTLEVWRDWAAASNWERRGMMTTCLLRSFVVYWIKSFA